MSLGGSSCAFWLSTTFVNGGNATASTPTTTVQAAIISHGARTTTRPSTENASMRVGIVEVVDWLATVNPSFVCQAGGGSGVTRSSWRRRLLRAAQWCRASPAHRAGEREVVQRARNKLLQVVIRVARLICNDRDEDLSVRSSGEQSQQSAGAVHRRLGDAGVAHLHGEVVGVGAVWPVGGRADRT